MKIFVALLFFAAVATVSSIKCHSYITRVLLPHTGGITDCPLTTRHCSIIYGLLGALDGCDVERRCIGAKNGEFRGHLYRGTCCSSDLCNVVG